MSQITINMNQFWNTEKDFLDERHIWIQFELSRQVSHNVDFSHMRQVREKVEIHHFPLISEKKIFHFIRWKTLSDFHGVAYAIFFSSSNSNLAIIDVQLLSQLVTHFLIEFLPFREIASVPKRLYTYMSFYSEQLKNKKRAKKYKNGGTITPHTFHMSFC